MRANILLPCLAVAAVIATGFLLTTGNFSEAFSHRDAAELESFLRAAAKEFPELRDTVDAFARALHDENPIKPAPLATASAGKLREEIVSLRIEKDKLQKAVGAQRAALAVTLREFVRQQEEAHKWDTEKGFVYGVISSLVASLIWIRLPKRLTEGRPSMPAGPAAL